MRQLTIDPEFRDKIPPLSADEFSKLEENVLADGEVREPLVVWHNTIIDGHHRYKIVQEHPEIPFKVKQMDFPDKWAAIVWMCRNQLGRRNLTDAQRSCIVAEQYEAQRKTIGAPVGNKNAEKQILHNEGIVSRSRGTAEEVAKQNGMTTVAVERAVRFSRGLDEAEKVSPGIKEAVLSGTVKAPKSVISEIRNAPEEKKREAVEAIKQGDTCAAKEILRPIPKAEPEEEAEPFTAKDLGDLIDAAVKNLDVALKLHLVLTHRDMLDTESGRAAAQRSIEKAIDVANKYLEMIRRIEERGEDD